MMVSSLCYQYYQQHTSTRRCAAT